MYTTNYQEYSNRVRQCVEQSQLDLDDEEIDLGLDECDYNDPNANV